MEVADIALAASTSPLCSTCRTTGPWSAAGWKDFHTRETYRTHLKWMREESSMIRSLSYELSVEQFHADAERCAWCAALLEQLGLPPTAAIAKEQAEFTGYSFSLEFCAPEGVRPVRINAIRVLLTADRAGGFTPFRARFNVLARPDSIADKVFLAPRATMYKDSEFNHKLAREWIDYCTSSHDQRGASPSTDEAAPSREESLPLLPTRILEISPDAENPEAPSIVLREAVPGQRGKYICLSYTWGPHTRHNFPQLARSLLRHDDSATETGHPSDAPLPVVFVDAAHVALKLGIRYLWIDALCIWQDDSADLKAELSEMHRYFSEATVVVQTSGTRSVDEPFLGEARNSAVGQMLHDALHAGSADGGDFLRLPYLHEHFQGEEGEQPRQIKEKKPEDSEPDASEGGQVSEQQEQSQGDVIFVIPQSSLPWPYDANSQVSASRGWIFQEENLCRRLLVFPSGGGMLYTCDSGTHSRTIQHDGQVNHHLPTRVGGGGRDRRPAGLPVWGKESLMSPSTGSRAGWPTSPLMIGCSCRSTLCGSLRCWGIGRSWCLAVMGVLF
ncbi:heterokaryon incompatibility protein-domain-containing protein [Microdochium trichocladiopsis]|uniref:Heterokaryon incompatibility protein-domain-containing protein n=1 Tax=Microdochium trichocladiopsis TaxID=1682393 RepID=A0A9P8XV59_9PEZI|nr:heterokaryon incompatibility protein-domain-containing protein [Microdochium trichocladiopsis]KAH7014382.1 heterokaryon incompatibility protein-domain-containing protein [Microdochium trichocladiopsis]